MRILAFHKDNVNAKEGIASCGPNETFISSFLVPICETWSSNLRGKKNVTFIQSWDEQRYKTRATKVSACHLKVSNGT